MFLLFINKYLNLFRTIKQHINVKWRIFCNAYEPTIKILFHSIEID